MPFRFDRLGVPSVRKGSSVGPAEGEQIARDRGTDVMYIHIPRHALKGFQNFARSVASECRRDNAADNPYVRALCNHRAELQNHSVIPCPTEAPSLEQKMASEREALSLMTPAEMPLLELGMADHECAENGCVSGKAWLAAWPPCSFEENDANTNGCARESWSLHVDPRRVGAGQPGYTATCSGHTPRRDSRPGFSVAGSPLRPVAPKPHLRQTTAESPLSPRLSFPAEQDESSLDDYL